jgi:hypothetical protein
LIDCYLCGKPIEGPASDDHVPPKQFYAPRIRQTHNLHRLTTLPTHRACNEAYGLDEEYYTWSLVPIAAGTVAADALIADNAAKFQAGGRQGLARQVLAEFDDRPGGLLLPNGKIIKRTSHSRVSRVQWKIVRGLYRLETGRYLPEEVDYLVEVREPEHTGGTEMDDFWEAVKAEPSKGVYQGVFAYKHKRFEAAQGQVTAVVHAWGTLLWNRLMIFVAHLDPDPALGPPRELAAT